MTYRVVVIGGTGAFGSRLVEGLIETTDCAVVIAGRSAAHGAALAARLGAAHPGREIGAATLDRDRVVAADLRALRADAVVDAAGPFQGRQPTVARAAIAAGIVYLDLADARDFVAAFPALDGDAQRAGVLAVTGASSTPALSNAVADALTAGWAGVHAIEVAISPGNRAPRGAAVVRAILSYVGRPIAVWENGGWRRRAGWSGLRRACLPGLRRRWLSLCETPDLDLIPRRFPGAGTAVFRAGLELAILHLGLAALGLAARAACGASLSALARPLTWLARRFERFGSDRGGMRVEARGSLADGRRAWAQWSLVAAAGAGPNIPALPALALLRRLAAGTETRRGACTAAGLLSLAQIEAEFRRFPITTQIDERTEPALFARALGAGFRVLPGPVQALHAGPHCMFEGEADVQTPAHGPARLLALALRLPRPGTGVPLRVCIVAHDDGETWTRQFGTSRVASRLATRRGCLTERFGPVVVALDLAASAHGLDFSVRGWRLGPLPLPRILAPWTRATETADATGRFRFDVEIGLPLIGGLVRYRGWLAPAAGIPPPATAGSMLRPEAQKSLASPLTSQSP